MKYYDLHCDSLTVCADNGRSLSDGGAQADFSKLKKSGCSLQCFAIFTEGENAARDFYRYLSYYDGQVRGDGATPVYSYADIARAESMDELACVLTVENLGFIGGDLNALEGLKAAGVKMASLVWNHANALAYPNLVFENGLPRFDKSSPEGLTPLGKEAVKRLEELKIIIDVSHLSDGGTDYILDNARAPVVASHSNSREVCPVSRNLTDAQIKKIADCGGVVGVNYCKDFLGGAPLDAVYRHIARIMQVGGEDVVALGSDFDGIPAYAELSDCLKLEGLFSYLSKRGITPRQSEKLRYLNADRVFKYFG